MRHLKSVILTTMLLLPLSPVLAAGFAGQYSAEIKGTPTTVTLRQSGGVVSGVMDASGYLYELSGRLQGGVVKGKLRDTRLGGILDIDMQVNGNTLILTMHAVNQQTGQRASVPLHFTRDAGRARPDVSAAPASGRIDPRLVGTWRKGHAYVSGNFSAASQVEMQLRADGTYSYGNSRVIGGGSQASFDTGTGGVTRGRWKAENRIVYNYDTAVRRWVPYARYGMNERGDALMFYFDNNSRELWERAN